MGAIRDVFRKLAEGLYSIGAIIVGGTVGVLATGALAAYHGLQAVYMAYKRAWDGFYRHVASALTVGVVQYPVGPAIYGSANLASAAYDAYKDK